MCGSWKNKAVAFGLIATASTLAAERDIYVTADVPHPGADQILWVPTFAQAEVAARETGRMILVMGSVSDWNGF